MFGSNARIGLLVPSSNAVIEPEFYGHLPDGVSLHATRMRSEGSGVDELEAMTDELLDETDLLTHVDVDVVVYGCTSGGFDDGSEHGTDLERRMQDFAETPAVATPASILRAFEALGLDSLAVVTPYPPEINELAKQFLAEAGFDVLTIERPEASDVTGYREVDSSLAYDSAIAANTPEADGLFISCTNYETFDIIDQLERELGKPVVTSNQATLWDAFCTAGLQYSPPNLGQLFE